MNLDNIEFDIKVIDDSFYHKVSEANKTNKEYDEIREIIIIEKNKLRDIIFSKWAITNAILYYKDRLWVSEFIYTFTI